ncbi:MAG: WhiB family transcriptional regulator [Actinomycetota bacterium]|nr:WhiB family transcriptional regulator [Actinomycetota bacterium]
MRIQPTPHAGSDPAALRDLVLAEDPPCLLDPELHSGTSGESPEDEAARVAVAREVCASCPARLPCRAFALLTRPQSGVWAGLTADQIVALADAAQGRAVRSAA